MARSYCIIVLTAKILIYTQAAHLPNLVTCSTCCYQLESKGTRGINLTRKFLQAFMDQSLIRKHL